MSSHRSSHSNGIGSAGSRVGSPVARAASRDHPGDHHAVSPLPLPTKAKAKGVLSIRFTEQGRTTLCLVLAIINWVCILVSLSLSAVGLYVKFSVEEFTNLITDYDGDSVPYTLLAVGILSGASNAVGGWLAFVSANPEKRRFLRYVHLGYVIWTLCICVAVLAGAILCFTHISHLEESFHGGITLAMQNYIHGDIHKRELDLLQMRHSCCGNEGYTDWFQIPWIHTDYLSVQTQEELLNIENVGGYMSDDTPFSCCSPSSHRPCVHHSVHDNSAHVNYDYREHITLNAIGCKDALMNFFGDQILTNGGAMIIGIFFLQLVLMLVTRYLQTSLSEAALSNDPTGPSFGYIFDCGGETAETGDKEELVPLTGPGEGGSPSALPRPSLVPGGRRSSLAEERRQSMVGGERRQSMVGGERRQSLGGERRQSMGGERRQSLADGRRGSTVAGSHRQGTMSPSRRSSIPPSLAPAPTYEQLPYQLGGVPQPPPPPPPPPVPGFAPNEHVESGSVDGWGSDEWDDEY